MIWIVAGVFLGGFFIGVLFVGLLAMARDPETRPSIPDEAETGYLQRRMASETGD